MLIVGAGPTGLVLACELARRGVSIRIVDRLATPSDRSRALVVQPRSLEILERLGLAGAFVEAGARVRSIGYFVDRRHVLQLDVSNLDLEDTPYPFLLNLPQDRTEAILAAHLAGAGIAVERGHELARFEQHDGGIRAVLRAADGGETTVESRYVVGCDGAHSTVRHALGIAFDGSEYPQNYLLADVDVAWDAPRDEIRLMLTKAGFCGVFPMPGTTRMRVMAGRHRDAVVTDDPSLAEMQAVVEEFSPIPARLSEPRWLTRFRLHHRLAARYSSGRAFLCGDAAHIHSPAGGQGMNTGIQDAWNLAWKLDLTLRGHGGGALLDSYDSERHLVGEFLLKSTDRLFQMAMAEGTAVTWLRKFLVPSIAKAVLAQPTLRRTALSTLTQLAIHYRHSPVVLPDEGGPAIHHGPLPGDRAPDAALVTPAGVPTRLFLETRGPRHQLLLFAAQDSRSANSPGAVAQAASALRRTLDERHPGLVDVHVIAPGDAPGALRDDGHAAERYGIRSQASFLIRPDGHVSWRGGGWSPEPVARYFARLVA